MGCVTRARKLERSAVSKHNKSITVAPASHRMEGNGFPFAARVALFVLLQAPSCSTMMAHLCSEEDTRYLTLDLMEAARCPDSDAVFEDPIQVEVELLQTDDTTQVTGHQCHVVYTKQITRCGSHGWTFATRFAAWQKYVETTPEECRRAIETGVIKVNHADYTIEKGKRMKFHEYTHGRWTDNDNCEVETFHSENRLWVSSVEEFILEIHVREIRGIANLETGRVVFSNGLHARYHDGILRDGYEGVIIWDTQELNCTERLSLVYKGTAELRRHSEREGNDGAIIMIANNGTGQYAGFALKGKPESVCGSWCTETQVDGMSICLLDADPKKRAYMRNFQHTFKQGDVGQQAQEGYLHVTTNLRMFRRFDLVYKDVCEVDRRLIHTQLNALANGDKYVLRHRFGTGHFSTATGTAVVIGSCPVVEVPRIPYPNCTLEIPVEINNRTMFADPFNFILQTYPTVLPCSPVTPIHWNIGGEWFCLSTSADPYPCATPGRLSSSTTPFRGEDFTVGMGESIFTAVQRALQMQWLEVVFARGAVGQRDVNTETNDGRARTGRFQGPLDSDDISSLTRTIGGLISPWYWLFGDGAGWIVGIFLTVLITKAIADCIVRAAFLFKTRGFGWWMLTALWASAFMLLTLPGKLIRAAVDMARKPLDPNGDNVAVLDEGNRPLTKADLLRMMKELEDRLRREFKDDCRMRHSNLRERVEGLEDTLYYREPETKARGRDLAALESGLLQPPEAPVIVTLPKGRRASARHLK